MNTKVLPATAQVAPRTLSTGLKVLFAAGAGISVASLHYSPPMLPDIAQTLHVGTGAVGLVPMLAQFGYAFGILFLSPLGDRYDRRRIMLIKSVLLALALAMAAAAGHFSVLLLASLVMGLAATLAQEFVPAAVSMAPEKDRGSTAGLIITGLLLGILLSRLVSGVLAESIGWRYMFGVAALFVVVLGVFVWFGVPTFKPTTQLAYGALMLSMLRMWGAHRPLRYAAIAQGLLSLAFSAFWSTLALMLHARFGLSSGVAGAFGLAGAAGAIAAPIAGRLADKRGPQLVTVAGASVAAISFLAMGAMEFLGPTAQLGLLIVTAITFDFGAQSAFVAHQSIVFGLEPTARSRINALFFTGSFVGMSAGALLGSMALEHGGWLGVVALATVSCVTAVIVRMRA